MRLADERRHELIQEAFSAFLDAALDARGHTRATLGMAAAVDAVIARLAEWGYVRGAAVHGTRGGRDAGCRCAFCTEASLLADRARTHWDKTQGDNKIRTAE